MTNESTIEGQREQRPVHLVDLIFPVLGTIFAIYYLSTVRDLPIEARMSAMLLSALIFIFSASFLLRFILQARRTRVRSGVTAMLGTGTLLWHRLGLLALTISYILALPLLGFTLGTFVFLICAFALLGVRSPNRLLVTSLAMALIAYLLFVVLLNATLSEGPVENLFNNLLQLVGVAV